MKIGPAFPVFWSLTLLLHGQQTPEVRTAPPAVVATIPVPAAAEAPETAPMEKPGFQIENTQVKWVPMAEQSPGAGVAPAERIITLTVHTVADPGLPDPPPPQADGSPAGASPAEVEARYGQSTAFISATVYDHSRTLLTFHLKGGRDKAVTVWSNLDFNHYRGVRAVEARSGQAPVRKYSLQMGIGDETTELNRRRSAAKGIAYEEPEIPGLPDYPPSFVILTENPDPETITMIEDLHALYRTEGGRLAEEFAVLEQAAEERRVLLLAHPPVPADVTVHFWKRGDNSGTEGAQP